MDTSPTIGAIAGALALARAGLRHAQKDRQNTHLRNRYATLESLIDAVAHPLAEQGIAISQGVEVSDGMAHVTTMLLHTSGEWLRARISLPIGQGKGVSEAQAAGSAITYARRYGLQAMVGVGADEATDDDGVAAGRRRSRETAEQREERQSAHHPSWAAARAAVAAELREAGTDIDAVSARLEAAGRPRLSALDPELRRKAIAWAIAPPKAR